MSDLNISPAIADKLKRLAEETQTSLDDLLSKFLATYAEALTTAEPIQDSETWDADEIADVLKPKQALSGKEMVEQGFVGGWEDMDIDWLYRSTGYLDSKSAKESSKLQMPRIVAGIVDRLNRFRIVIGAYLRGYK